MPGRGLACRSASQSHARATSGLVGPAAQDVTTAWFTVTERSHPAAAASI
jgi:hypothetical protein